MIEFLARLFSLIGDHLRSRHSRTRLIRTKDAGAVQRLNSFLQDARRGEEYTFEYLAQRLPDLPIEKLAAAVAILVEEGVLQQAIRIESPTTHGGIADFPSIQDVPEEIHDWRAGEYIHVRPEDLRVVYTPLWQRTNSPHLALM